MKQPIQKVDYLIVPTKLRPFGGLKEPKKFFYKLKKLKAKANSPWCRSVNSSSFDRKPILFFPKRQWQIAVGKITAGIFFYFFSLGGKNCRLRQKCSSSFRHRRSSELFFPFRFPPLPFWLGIRLLPFPVSTVTGFLGRKEEGGGRRRLRRALIPCRDFPNEDK